MTQKTIVENLSQKDSNEKAGLLRPTAVRRRAAARLASVQLGYSAEVTGQPLLEAMPTFLDNYADDIARQLRVKKWIVSIFMLWFQESITGGWNLIV